MSLRARRMGKGVRPLGLSGPWENPLCFSFLPRLPKCISVLVLAGVELIFLIVASMGWCFGVVLETLITQRCFPYCWAVLTQSQGLFCSSSHPTSEGAGGAQKGGRGHSQDSWPRLTTGISHTIRHRARHVKWGEGWRGGHCSGTGWASVSWWGAAVFVCITCLSWVLFLSLSCFPFHYIYY